MFNKSLGLEEGEFTQINDYAKSISQCFDINGKHIRRDLSFYVRDLKYMPDKTYEFFRKRTGCDVLKSGYVTGCSDTGLAFIVLARSLNIPTLFVETFDKNWLESEDYKLIKGHIFLDLFIDGEWRSYEPKTGFITDNKGNRTNNEYFLGEKEFTVVGKGVDHSQIYLRKKDGTYNEDPCKIESMKFMHELKRNFKKNNSFC
jgi:hypothetical protein